MSTSPNITDWTLEDLQEHLKFAIDLEFWTIPFYRVAYHAAGSANADAQTAIDEVSQEEMFHCQSAWNIAQAFGVTDYDFTQRAPVYQGTDIPHLNFALESPDPSKTAVTIGGNSYDFSSYSAELDTSSFSDRINAMCLVEYPDWDAPSSQQLEPDVTNYASIGHFYAAIQTLLNEDEPQAFKDGTLVSDAITGNGGSQIALFSGLAPSGVSEKITESGTAGMTQINNLINAIVEEGEGTSSAHDTVPSEYQFNGDEDPHFNTFLKVYNEGITQQTMAADGVEKINEAMTPFLQSAQNAFAKGETSGFVGDMITFDDVIAAQFS